MTPARSDLIMLADGWRVRPLDEIQWVLEHRPDGRIEPDTERWLPKACCRTKSGLLTAASRLMAEGAVLDAAPLAALPDNFDGSPPVPRRELLIAGTVAASEQEINAGIGAVLASGMTLDQIGSVIERHRSEIVRLLALVGLQDEQSAADLERIKQIAGELLAATGDRRRARL
jgi:hypothetical protein